MNTTTKPISTVSASSQINTQVKYDCVIEYTKIIDAYGPDFSEVNLELVLLQPQGSNDLPYGIDRSLFRTLTAFCGKSPVFTVFTLKAVAGKVQTCDYGCTRFVLLSSVESLTPAPMGKPLNAEAQENKRLNALVDALATENENLEFKVDSLTTQLASKDKMISHLEYEKRILESQNGELRAQLESAFAEIKRLSPNDFKEGQVVKIKKLFFKVAKCAGGLGMVLLGSMAAAGAVATAPVSAPIAMAGGVLIGTGGSVVTHLVQNQ